MVVIVLGTGIFLSLRFGFSYQRKLKFNIKKYLRQYDLRRRGRGHGIELPRGLYGACEYGRHGEYQRRCNGNCKRRTGRTCLDVGFCIFRNVYKGMRIILGQRYREHYKNSMDEYVCDRSFVMKNAFGWKRGAIVLAVFAFVLGPWTCCVQTEAVTSSMQQPSA